MTAMIHVPAYLWALVLAGTVGITALTGFVLYRGALLADSGGRGAVRLGVGSVLLIGGWFAVSGVIAGQGGYLSGHGRLPGLPFAFAGALVAMVAATLLPLVARALAAPGMLSRLELPHTFRVVGAAFLIMMALGHLPALFAVPAGVGDILTGIAAPFVARRVAKGGGHRVALWFNAFGMADLIAALTLAILTGLHAFSVSPSSKAITELPLALIPTAAVPLLFTLHITSVRRLLAVERKRRSTLGGAGLGAPSLTTVLPLAGGPVHHLGRQGEK
ncbi:hypothetical protein ACWC4C_04335 [Streptomyces olivaceoviridis]